ncbi:MAG: HlyD family efflux transporter periplasmic adaptor subunit [Gammaproteobacteria bacterium]|nr:HlyD family efflux transporter periplasmic adaptor subunit [Gammaproteobacteria bacterium]
MTQRFTVQWKTTVIALIIVTAAIGFLLKLFQTPELPPGIASGNGRIEAVEVDITTKFGGRLASVLVNEGDSVDLNQALAQIDTKELDAQLRRAEAEVRRARQEKNSAVAVIAQRKSELSLAKKDLERSKGLYEHDSISLEQLQRDETAVTTAEAALAVAHAQFSNTEAAIEAAVANTELLKVQIEDSILKTPISGRVLYRLAEPGEVLPTGGKVLTVLDLTDASMTIFLPTLQAGRLRIGDEARIVLDAMPEYTIPAKVSFVSPEAQFTPKEVETRTEREKLMFRVKVRIDPALLAKHSAIMKTGVPGVAYVRLGTDVAWPESLQVRLPP